MPAQRHHVAPCLVGTSWTIIAPEQHRQHNHYNETQPGTTMHKCASCMTKRRRRLWLNNTLHLAMADTDPHNTRKLVTNTKPCIHTHAIFMHVVVVACDVAHCYYSQSAYSLIDQSLTCTTGADLGTSGLIGRGMSVCEAGMLSWWSGSLES